MMRFLRKWTWWLQRRRKQDDLRDELEFHLAEEADEHRARGVPEDLAQIAARRDLGNVTLVREDARTLWTWILVEQLVQDVRYAARMMRQNRTFTIVVTLSLALGIGANTAIYSFMDAILLRSLPVHDPASLVALKWHSKPFAHGSRATNGSEFVLHEIDGDFFEDETETTGAILPYPAFEQLRQVSGPVLSSTFAFFRTGKLNAIANGRAELATGEYVTGEFFQGLAVSPMAGRLLFEDDDRAGAPPVAVIDARYADRRFGAAVNATGQSIVINNVPFTIVGVTPPGFFGVDPGEVPDVYLPMQAMRMLDADGPRRFIDPAYYWVEVMGRLRPGVSRTQAQAVMAGSFDQWVATTASNDRERANLPRLRVDDGAAGRDILRRQYKKPLYVLLAMVGLILAIACANTANLLLARATARRREIAMRLGLGASRMRVVRQLLTESVLLASIGAALGVLIAQLGIRVLTALLANGQQGFTLHAELNGHVLAVTLGLAVCCGVLFGLAPAMRSTRDARPAMVRGATPRLSLSRGLVVAQMALSLLLLVAAGLFVRTLSNLHSIPLGFERDHVLLFDVNASQAQPDRTQVAAFYATLRDRLSEIPGVHAATLSHASLIKAGRAHSISVDGVPVRGHRILSIGPRFFTTMQIPMLRGREIDERDRARGVPAAVVSADFATHVFGAQDPIGRRIRLGGPRGWTPIDLEIVGVAAAVRYGGLKRQVPPDVVYVPYAVSPQLDQVTYAVRTDGDPLRYVSIIRDIVHAADARVPVANVRTQAVDIDQTINQEIVFARLCTAFAMLALVIASVGLYGTMTYAVARRTKEIGVRMALGARRGAVTWMVLREVSVLAAIGLAISLPVAVASSRLIEAFLFGVKPNDPRALAAAAAILVGAALLAGYGPSRRASRVDPMIALRHE